MGLVETKEEYEEEILSRVGVLGIGVGKDSIIVYVNEGETVDPPLPATLDEWPVVIIPTEPFEMR